MDLNEKIIKLYAMKAEAQPYLDAIKALETEIKAHCLETGEAHPCISYRSGYERVSWDSKALVGYAAAHPEIEVFRKVSIVSPSVSIKIRVDGALTEGVGLHNKR